MRSTGSLNLSIVEKYSSFASIVLPSVALLEAIEMGPGNETGMLEHPDDDTRRDPLFVREGADISLASLRSRDEPFPIGPCNERVGSPLICLGLGIGSTIIRTETTKR